MPFQKGWLPQSMMFLWKKRSLLWGGGLTYRKTLLYTSSYIIVCYSWEVTVKSEIRTLVSKPPRVQRINLSTNWWPGREAGSQSKVFSDHNAPCWPQTVADTAIKGEKMSNVLAILTCSVFFRFKCLDSIREKVSMKALTVPSKWVYFAHFFTSCAPIYWKW